MLMLPILISVSLAPGSYLFCAAAEPAANVMLPNMMTAVIHVRWNLIKSSQISCCFHTANTRASPHKRITRENPSTWQRIRDIALDQLRAMVEIDAIDRLPRF